jgi:hypothetical protein
MPPAAQPNDDALARALALLEAGDWRAAHALVQRERGPLAAWLHGIAHTLEGDLDNARYWYRRTGRPFPGAGAVRQELARARQALEAAGSPPPAAE